VIEKGMGVKENKRRERKLIIENDLRDVGAKKRVDLVHMLYFFLFLAMDGTGPDLMCRNMHIQ